MRILLCSRRCHFELLSWDSEPHFLTKDLAVEWLVGGESKRGCPGPVVMMKLLPPATANVPKITIPSNKSLCNDLHHWAQANGPRWDLQVQFGGQLGASLHSVSSSAFIYLSDKFQL